ncbi:MAG: ABC transporter permease, partial [Clostridia bacterium]|nr:ABC transporter permease [Clostridia bacterium]
VLRKNLRLSPAALLRSGGETAGHRGLRLTRLAPLGANAYLALNDLCARKKLYATFLFVLTLAAFVVIVPQNLYATVSSKSFVGYMGTGLCDMRIDLQQGTALAKQAQAIQTALASDPDVETAALFTTRGYALSLPDGSRERISIDLGDHALFPAQYQQGRAPAAADEIALSSLQADALAASVGDTLTILSGDTPRTLTVCGVYADVTNGGKTAKASFSDETTDVMRYMFAADFAKGTAQARIAAYQAAFPDAKVSDVERYVAQTLAGSISAMRTAARAALFAALLLAGLITALFLRMLLSKDARSVAVLRALGFTHGDIRAQYLWRAIIIALLGFVLGTLLANTLGERLAGMLIASLGASGLRFCIDPLRAYLMCPALLSLSVLASAMLSLASAGRIPLCDHVRNE